MLVTQQTDAKFDLEAALPVERARLVRLCAYLSGDSNVAEDLAQETLIEAWRHQNKLVDPEGHAQWLSAIARNICLRHARSRGRELAHFAQLGDEDENTNVDLEDQMSDDFDLEVELERDELARLLDQAMALLPSETRTVLVQHYIQESPHTEIAERLGLSEGAVSVRLHRGKLALRRLLSTQFADEAAVYGLSIADTDTWRETSIWCPICGQRRLIGRFPKSKAEFSLRCPRCSSAPEYYIAHVDLRSSYAAQLLSGVRAFKPALSRLMGGIQNYFREALANGTAPCLNCGRSMQLQFGPLRDGPGPMGNLYGINLRCVVCNESSTQTLAGLALSLPEGRRFLKEHPRLRTLPDREVEAAGCPSLVSSFESVVDSARFDVISARGTLEVIGIHTVP